MKYNTPVSVSWAEVTGGCQQAKGLFPGQFRSQQTNQVKIGRSSKENNYTNIESNDYKKAFDTTKNIQFMHNYVLC